MIYKIETRVDNLEVTLIEKEILLTLKSPEGGEMTSILDKNQLYDLIGVLHSLQAKLKVKDLGKISPNWERKFDIKLSDNGGE